MRFYLKKEVKQLLDNSNGEIKAATKSSFHLAKGTSNGLYQIKGITSSNEPNIVHISEDINMLNKKSGKIIHHHKNYKLKKSGIKNLLKESPLKLTDGIIHSDDTPYSKQVILNPVGVFRKLPISGEKKENKIKVKSKIKKDKSEKKDKESEKKDKLEIKKDKENEKKIKSVIKKDKKKETKEAKETKKKVKSEIKKDKSKKKGEKKIKSEIKKLKKVITENK